MRLQREDSASFAGGVNDASAPDEYLPNQVQSLVNVRVSPRGNTLEVLRGHEVLKSGVSSTSQLYGLIEFPLANGTIQWVRFVDDEAEYSTDEGATWTTISGATGLTEEYWSLVIYREGSVNVLCCANGGTNTYQYDGTTWATISNIENDVKYLAVMGDRLIAAGHDGISVAASVVGNIDSWATASGGWTVRAITHDGDTEITGLFTLGSSVLVFKSESVGFIEGFGFQTLQVSAGARGLSRSTGCVAFRTIQACGDDGVMWLSKRGFEYFATGGRIQLASAQQQKFIAAISTSVIAAHPGLPCAVWWPSQREYICALPVANAAGSEGLGTAANTWAWCFRPQTEITPPAVHMRSTISSTHDSLTIDSNGELDLLADDQSGFMGNLANDGSLDVGRMPTPGRFFSLTNSELEFSGAGSNEANSPFWAALAIASHDGDPDALIAGGHNQGIYHLENPAETPLVSIVRTRPFVGGDQFTRKKAKRATVLASQDEAVTGTLTSIADGVPGTEHSLAFTANVGEEAQERKARIGGRGRQHVLEYRTEGPQEIRGFSFEAQPLEDQS